MKSLSNFIFEMEDDSKFKKSKLKFGTVCFRGDASRSEQIPMIYIPKKEAQIMCDLFDVPFVGDMFLFRNIYNKADFMILRGSDFNGDLKNKQFRSHSIVKYYIKPISAETLKSRTFKYDFEDTIKKFMEEQGDQYYERDWMNIK